MVIGMMSRKDIYMMILNDIKKHQNRNIKTDKLTFTELK